MKKIIGGLGLGTLSIVSVFVFQNCSKSNLNLPSVEESVKELESQTNPLIKECLPNAKQKISEGDLGPKVPTDFSTFSLGPELRLLALIDNKCAEKVQAGILRRLILPNQDYQKKIDVSAYSFFLDRVYSHMELENLAAEDSCIQKIDLNPVLQLTQNQGDPKAAEQIHLNTIQHALVYDKLFNSNNGINSSVRVAVIDSGVDLYHPDLKDSMLLDSFGKIFGYNAISEALDFADSGFHGTHVAGLIGSTSGNGINGRGVLGRNINLIPIKVSNDGTSVDANAVINGIRWAADQGAEVINMSLGGTLDRPAFRESIQYALDKGVFIVVAAGNNGKQLGSQINIYPAMYSKDYSGMITVGSIDATTKSRSSFSNYSTTFVDIMAPGSDGTKGILSTVPSSKSSSGMASQIIVNGVTSPIHGTSMATPVASGAAAVVYALAKSRGYRPSSDQVEKALLNAAETSTSLTGVVSSGRMLNLNKLVSFVDADMNLSVSSSVSRNYARGVVNIQTQPANQQAVMGSQATFSVDLTTSSSTFVNYQWFKNNRPIAGANRKQLVLQNVGESSADSYYVVVRAGSTEVVSQRATLTIGKAFCN